MYTLNSNTIRANTNKNALRELCKKHNIKNYGKLNNTQMRVAINQKLAVGTMFKQAVKKANVVTPVNSWVNMLTPPPPAAKQQRLQTVVTKKQRVRNLQTHPKRGGKTYAVWVQMRYYLAVHKMPLKQAKQAVRAWGVQNNQKVNMVNAQIYRYCKYHGLLTK